MNRIIKIYIYIGALKIIDAFKELQQENAQLKEQRSKAIDFINKNVSNDWSICDTSVIWKVLEILESNKED